MFNVRQFAHGEIILLFSQIIISSSPPNHGAA